MIWQKGSEGTQDKNVWEPLHYSVIECPEKSPAHAEEQLK